ncbi:MAG TPA: hypothetical protein VJ873_02050, partial [bacterium]|nr:hypothetical protein [bacterium]
KMKKALILSLLLAVVFFPIGLQAIPQSEIQDRLEMSQVWVDQHNAKLTPEVQNAVKGIRVKPHVYFIGSRHIHLIPMKRAPRGTAAKYGIPASVKTASGAVVPLVSLRYSKAEGQSFLTADYADELDTRHSSSDIYIKIGLEYHHLFHGEGYPGAARIVSLGKEMPVFFEVGIYGGGSRCDKTFYRLDNDALKGVPDELYDHPELIQAEKYVKEELKVNVWLEGFTLYRDVDKDGSLDIINTTDVLYPPDLKTKVQERYKLTDNDFAGAFRRVTSVYKWDTAKLKFVDLGDYYH